MGYRALPVSDLPAVDFPTISVNACSAGRQPGDDGRRPSRRRSRSSSPRLPASRRSARRTALGSTSITLQFDLDRDIDAAAQDVQAAISRTVRQLPPDMPPPPSLQKVNPADSPILFLTLSSRDAAALAGQRVRRDQRRAAHLDGEGRRAGRRLRRAEVRGADRRRSAAARGARTRHRRGRERRSRAAASTGRRARCTGPTGRSPSRPTGS